MQRSSTPTPRDEFGGKSVLILGLARQGMALARFFCRAGARVTISDAAPREALGQELAQIRDLPVTLALGGHPTTLLDECDLLCLSGGVPAQLPLVQEAIRRGIPLSNDSLLTIQRAPCPVIAITGSSGKTTTTTLVGEMLAQSAVPGQRVHVGGNIGQPLIHRLDEIGPDDLMVLELSSFQLEIFDPAIAYGELAGMGPDVAAILNITPNHLDRHPSMAAYTDAKLNLLRHLRPDARVILSGDDPVTRQLLPPGGEGTPASPPKNWQLEGLLNQTRQALADQGVTLLGFSQQAEQVAGAWLAGEELRYRRERFARRSEVRLRGDHNVSNLLAAAAISGSAGASVPAMGQVAHTFSGVPHRLEEVLTHAGVTWINDSIATAPERAVAGLRCFPPGEQTLILLAGGKDKNLPWEGFADEVLRRVTYLIGFGQAGAMIVNAVQERASHRQSQPPSAAVVRRLEEAVHLASQIALPGSVVLLSPGGTSYDAYKNFEERGEHFRSLVHALAREYAGLTLA